MIMPFQVETALVPEKNALLIAIGTSPSGLTFVPIHIACREGKSDNPFLLHWQLFLRLIWFHDQSDPQTEYRVIHAN